MDASTIFYKLISKIETSGLNYAISKSPFSAKIYVKRPFIRNFNEPSHKETTQIYDKSEEATDFKENVTSTMEQKVKLEEMLKQERIKIKTLESQIYQFREELLVVKNERNLSNTKLKTQKNDINRSNQELVIVNQAKNILENNVKGQDRLVVDKTIECKQLIEENVEL